MRVASIVKAIPVAVIASFAPLAHAQACDVEYVIQPGDTLISIAKLAYGAPSFEMIAAANAGKLAGQAELPVGETITIPCIPGVASMTPNEVALSMAMLNFQEDATETPETDETESAAQPEEDVAATESSPATPSEDVAVSEEETPPVEEAEEAVVAVTEDSVQAEAPATDPEPEPEPETVVATTAQPTEPTLTPVGGITRMRLLTANGQAPFADQSLRGRGMATELAARALDRLGIGETSRIVFVDDREAHLSDLLVDGSFDLGFPWFRPTCELMAKLEELSPDDAWLCKNYNFSEPFYEFVYGFFTPKGAYTVARTTFLDFSDARICRPAGPSIMDLKINGLDGEEVTFVRPETLAECFALLQAGEVDAVSGEAFEAENLLAELGLFDEVEELPNLGLLQTVHAIAHNARPGADDALATMNKGLIELKVSGEWFRIVGRHLAKN